MSGAIVGCSSDSDTTDVATSNNCAITSFVLGGIPCVMHTTTDDGRDSTYEAVLTGANYPLSIDQLNNRIYLNDSLPVGSDISRITFSSVNHTGVSMAIRSIVTAQDTIFNTADSTDCSLPRLFTVFASDGSSRSYTLELRVHKQSGDEMDWKQVATADEVAALQELKVLAVEGTLYVFGRRDGACELITSTDQGATWQRQSVSADLATRSVHYLQGTFVGLSRAGEVLVSTDAQTWNARSGQTFTALFVGSDAYYGLADAQIWSSQDLNTWKQDALSTTDALPVAQWDAVVLPSRTNSHYEDLILAGLDADAKPALWHRTIDTEGNYNFAWNKLQTSTTHNYPILQSTSLLAYDDAPVVIGLPEENPSPELYISRDRGRTWLNTEIALPEAASATAIGATVDADNHLWVICGGTGQIWRGRLARLAWKKTTTQFYRAPKRGK